VLGPRNHGMCVLELESPNGFAKEAHRAAASIDQEDVEIRPGARHDDSRETSPAPEIDHSTLRRQSLETSQGIDDVLAEERLTIPIAGQVDTLVPGLEELEESADALDGGGVEGSA